MLEKLIYHTAYLGYVVGGIFVILGIALLVGLVVRDVDEFTPIGDAIPSPPRRSPFVDSATVYARRSGTATPTSVGRRA